MKLFHAQCLVVATLAAGMLGCGGELPREVVRTAETPIIGGVIDRGDPAVVVLAIHQAGEAFRQVCSGFLVSPHVIVTAAHCVHPRTIQDSFPQIGTDFIVEVFPAADVLENDWANPIPAKSWHYDPRYDDVYEAAAPRPYDTAVVILKDPLAIAPLPMNRAALTPFVRNVPLRLVGYGLTDGNGGLAGVRYQTVATLTSYTDEMIFIGDKTRNQCHGDSGGPALLQIDGVDTVVGISSWGPPNSMGQWNCSAGSYDVRMDRAVSFVDPFIMEHDPPTAPDGGTPPADAMNDPSTPAPTVDGGSTTPTTPTTPDVPNGNGGTGNTGGTGSTGNGAAEQGVDTDSGANLATSNPLIGGCAVAVATGRRGTGGSALLLFIIIGALAMRKRLFQGGRALTLVSVALALAVATPGCGGSDTGSMPTKQNAPNGQNNNQNNTNPGGSNPGGSNPGGSNPGGSNPGGSNPGGTNPGGTNPGGTNPGGTNPGGTTPDAGTNPDSATSPDSGTIPDTEAPANQNEAALACIHLGSCLINANVNDCFTEMLHLLTPTEIRCMSNARGNCFSVVECLGLTLSSIGQDKLCDPPNPPRFCTVFSPSNATVLPVCMNTSTKGICDGTDAVHCTNGGKGVRYPCSSLVAGTSCKAMDGDSYCAASNAGTSGTACEPRHGTESCSDGKLTFCAAGVAQTVDCKMIGFSGCSRRHCENRPSR